MRSPSLAAAFRKLEGERISSVEFVLQDYVQLRFDGPCLNVYTPHHITHGEIEIAWGDPCYCDALCKLIGLRIVKTSVAEQSELMLVFENGAVWAMSLRDEDYTGPEALYFVQDSNWWVC